MRKAHWVLVTTRIGYASHSRMQRHRAQRFQARGRSEEDGSRRTEAGKRQCSLSACHLIRIVYRDGHLVSKREDHPGWRLTPRLAGPWSAQAACADWGAAGVSLRRQAWRWNAHRRGVSRQPTLA
jgi:hypothetical protein